jgi:hypothetical protein
MPIGRLLRIEWAAAHLNRLRPRISRSIVERVFGFEEDPRNVFEKA